MSSEAIAPLPQRLSGWGFSSHSNSQIVHPASAEEIATLFSQAKGAGQKITLRGSGCSYGDPALNEGGWVLALDRLNQILDWDAPTGILRAQPGVTIRQTWQKVVGDGWWPPVVPGTMEVSLGGAAAMNVHGKNNWKAGTIGDHILSFELLTPGGQRMKCDRETNADLFHAAIGGFGVLGVMTEVTLQMKRVHSGLLRVMPRPSKSLGHMFDLFEELHPTSDYLVGWMDGFASANALGRGLVHAARHLKEGEDPQFALTRQVALQELPTRFFGVVPKSWMWMGLYPFANNPGMRLVNLGKHLSGLLHGTREYLQPHAAFHFLLDYVPGWKNIYRPGGLIQHQIFVPEREARRVFAEVIALTQSRGIPSWLCVMKKHRRDPFLMTHAVDGYSLAMDFPVTRANRQRLWAMCHEITEKVLAAGGRFYFAKDSVLRPTDVERAWPEEIRTVFLNLKCRVDPDGILTSDLARRVWPGLSA